MAESMVPCIINFPSSISKWAHFIKDELFFFFHLEHHAFFWQANFLTSAVVSYQLNWS
jgi:hypothetical protein